MLNTKRMLWVTLFSCTLLATIGGGMAAAAAGGEIRIGFTPPITGASAAEGSFQIKAIKLALKEINAAGGVNGKQINLIMVDNQSTNPGALAALQKAVEQEKVLALIGFVKSTQILATSDAIKGYGIPTFIGGTNVTLTRQGNPWLFRVRPDDSIAAPGHGQVHQGRPKLTQGRHPARHRCLRHGRRRTWSRTTRRSTASPWSSGRSTRPRTRTTPPSCSP